MRYLLALAATRGAHQLCLLLRNFGRGCELGRSGCELSRSRLHEFASLELLAAALLVGR